MGYGCVTEVERLPSKCEACVRRPHTAGKGERKEGEVEEEIE